ncbi:hypothetical protein ACHAXA_002417 [Cyclostephanos tholiformis]|uniref:Uncharacterized protein n=1 Tax=Cyclostephanos tholiformis TaxID=382380 RepID=A0ABD3RZY6_9STRA
MSMIRQHNHLHPCQHGLELHCQQHKGACMSGAKVCWEGGGLAPGDIDSSYQTGAPPILIYLLSKKCMQALFGSSCTWHACL